MVPRNRYSQTTVVRGADLLFISGQGPIDENGNLAGSTVAEQTRQVFENLETALRAHGCGWDDLAKLGIFLTDIADFPEFSAVREEFLRASTRHRLLWPELPWLCRIGRWKWRRLRRFRSAPRIDMRYTTLGNTGDTVSILGCGTMWFADMSQERDRSRSQLRAGFRSHLLRLCARVRRRRDKSREGYRPQTRRDIHGH